MLRVATVIAARMLVGPTSKLKMAAEAVHRTYYRCRERRAQSGVASLFLDKRRKHRHRRPDGDCWLLLPGTASKPRNTRSANAMTTKILRQAKRLMAANKKMSAAATQRGKDAPHITGSDSSATAAVAAVAAITSATARCSVAVRKHNHKCHNQ